MTVELSLAPAGCLALVLLVMGGALGFVASGWRLCGGRPVRRQGRHAASSRDDDSDAGSEPSGEALENVELALSPQTGRLVAASDTVPEGVVNVHAPPVARQVTGSSGAELSGTAPTGAPRLGWALPTLSLDDERRADLLRRAWIERDVDALAAQGEADPLSAGAAFTLAGWAGRAGRDARAEMWLHRALQTGAVLEQDPFLLPFLADVSFSADFPQWGLTGDLPCSREALAVTIAAHEVRAGDLDAAYGALLDAADTDRVVTLRALVAGELSRWRPALTSARSACSDAGWLPLRQVVAARALMHAGGLEGAAAVLDEVFEALADGTAGSAAHGGPLLRCHALYTRAAIRRAGGDLVGAWEDLAEVLELAPQFPGAAQALKDL